jgi:hypothetical protein
MAKLAFCTATIPQRALRDALPTTAPRACASTRPSTPRPHDPRDAAVRSHGARHSAGAERRAARSAPPPHTPGPRARAQRARVANHQRERARMKTVEPVVPERARSPRREPSAAPPWWDRHTALPMRIGRAGRAATPERQPRGTMSVLEKSAQAVEPSPASSPELDRAELDAAAPGRQPRGTMPVLENLRGPWNFRGQTPVYRPWASCWSPTKSSIAPSSMTSR